MARIPIQSGDTGYISVAATAGLTSGSIFLRRVGSLVELSVATPKKDDHTGGNFDFSIPTGFFPPRSTNGALLDLNGLTNVRLLIGYTGTLRIYGFTNAMTLVGNVMWTTTQPFPT